MTYYIRIENESVGDPSSLVGGVLLFQWNKRQKIRRLLLSSELSILHDSLDF